MVVVKLLILLCMPTMLAQLGTLAVGLDMPCAPHDIAREPWH